MVYMSGSKMARNATSIMNRATCGGTNKGGLAPSIGRFVSSNPQNLRATNTLYGLTCRPNLVIQVQHYGYKATLGG